MKRRSEIVRLLRLRRRRKRIRRKKIKRNKGEGNKLKSNTKLSGEISGDLKEEIGESKISGNED